MRLINKILAKIDLTFIKRSRIDNAENKLKQLQSDFPKVYDSLIQSSCVIASREKYVNIPPGDDVLNIAVHVMGGIGDALIALAWIKELYKQSPIAIRFDIYARDSRKKNLELFVKTRNYIHAIYSEQEFSKTKGYDITCKILYHIDIIYISKIDIMRKCPEFIKIIETISSFNSPFAHCFRTIPPLHGIWANICLLNGWNRWDELGASKAIVFSRRTKAAFDLSAESSLVLEKFGLTQPYITIHRGIDATYPERIRSRAIKIWPQKNASAFCLLFQQKFPDISIVQIGTDNMMIIPEVDICLVTQTSLAESAAILKHALVHVDGDSGLTHLRHQLGGRSVVLFSQTPAEYFGYDGNINLRSPFCNNCFWLLADTLWFAQCVRGFESPPCMKAITPESVMQAVETILSQREKYKVSFAHCTAYKHNINKKIQTTIENDEFSSFYIKEKEKIKFVCNADNLFPESAISQLLAKCIQYANVYTKHRIAIIGIKDIIFPLYLSTIGNDVYIFIHNSAREFNTKFERELIKIARNQKFAIEYGSKFNIPADDSFFDTTIVVDKIATNNNENLYVIKEMLRITKYNGDIIYASITDSANSAQALSKIADELEKFGILKTWERKVEDPDIKLKEYELLINITKINKLPV